MKFPGQSGGTDRKSQALDGCRRRPGGESVESSPLLGKRSPAKAGKSAATGGKVMASAAGPAGGKDHRGPDRFGSIPGGENALCELDNPRMT